MRSLKRSRKRGEAGTEGRPGRWSDRIAKAGRSRFSEALREGGLETRDRLREAPAIALDRLGRALRTLGAVTADLARGFAEVALAAVGAASGPLETGAGKARALLEAASAAVTPARALLVATLGCSALLGLSQFADYRGVAVGVDNFAEGVGVVAPPPELERAETGSAHGYALLPAALLAIGVVTAAARSRRWQLSRLAALIGVGAIAVSLGVDRPAGLDEGELAEQFAGVEARLLGGFWTQLSAGAALAVTSLLLGGELRRERRAAPRARSASPPSRPAATVAAERA